MSTLNPRPPYDEEELAKLYPSNLQLQKVQIILRHGERTPVSSRFKNAGLPSNWPYCQAANTLKSVVVAADGSWDHLTWKRRLETVGSDAKPATSTGPNGEVDGICQPGELTDKGRNTTLALGQRLRTLYVDQLGFLSPFLDEKTKPAVSLRATPVQRALESVQQTFSGLYPAVTRTPGLSPPTITQRLMHDETLLPNEDSCRRLAELSHAFADRAAKLWNDSPEMKYINRKIGKWMPKESPVIKVDSHPRLSGIMDTVNATLGHGSATKLPAEFYDQQMLDNINRICNEEWYGGYEESNEFRKLGIGALIGDLTQHMVEHTRGIAKVGESVPSKISLAGCHDTTLAGTLAALGAYKVDRDRWPPYTSSVAFELFRSRTEVDDSSPTSQPSNHLASKQGRSWWSFLFPSSAPSSGTRDPLSSMPDADKRRLDDYYVRIRYNDTPLTLPACQPPGKHLPGEESFCTLAAFKEAADSMTPKDWKAECRSNLGAPAFVEPPSPPPGVTTIA